MKETALEPVRSEGALERLEELASQLELLGEAYRRVMKEGVDYATIPGTQKPTLLQPGAEKLARIFNLSCEEEVISIERNGDFLSVTVRVKVYRGEELIGSAIGSANTYESRYRYRWADSVGKPSEEEIAHMLADGTGRWVKRDGKWVFQVRRENPDKYDLFNTVIKMAAKRAFVSAIKRYTAASSFFLVDVEDLYESGLLGHHEENNEPEQLPADELTDATRRKLFAVFREMGVTDREQQLDIIEQVTGRRPSSRARLTESEARQVIEHITGES